MYVSLILSLDWIRNPSAALTFHPVMPPFIHYPSSYRSTALCIRILKDLGITAVVNCAQGEMTDWNYVNTKASYYSGANVRFFGIPAIDLKHYPINQHFYKAAEFIHQELTERGGKIALLNQVIFLRF